MSPTAAAPSLLSEPPGAGACGEDQHLVEFYESDASLAATVTSFLAPSFSDAGATMVVATPAHRAAFEQALTAAGVDVAAAAAGGRYVSIDAAELLATLMVDGAPDVARFASEVGGLLDRMAQPGRGLRIYGEMVALLWEAGDATSALALEHLWNATASTYSFDLLCGYRIGTFDNEEEALAFRRVCDVHASRPEQVLLAELAYADAVTTVLNRRASEKTVTAPPAPRRAATDGLILAAWRNASQLMASPGGRVLGDIVASEVAGPPHDTGGVLPG